MRFHRLLGLLETLRARRSAVTARSLAQSCAVSVRTIYRDIEALQSMGVPVRGEAGVGYRLDRGYFLPAIHFDVDEIDAIAFGMAMVAARGDPQLVEAASRVSAKIRSTAPSDRVAAFDRTPAVAAVRETPAHDLARQRLKTLRDAVRRRAVLEIRYRSLDGALTSRRCRPLGLAAFDNAWLLAAWCETRAGFRHFRLDRIEVVETTGEGFRDEPGKTFADCRARDQARLKPRAQPRIAQSDAA